MKKRILAALLVIAMLPTLGAFALDAEPEAAGDPSDLAEVIEIEAPVEEEPLAEDVLAEEMLEENVSTEDEEEIIDEESEVLYDDSEGLGDELVEAEDLFDSLEDENDNTYPEGDLSGDYYTGLLSPAVIDYLATLPPEESPTEQELEQMEWEANGNNWSCRMLTAMDGANPVSINSSRINPNSFSYSYQYGGTKKYYNALQTALNSCTGDQRTDILKIALSQSGYHKGNDASEFHGENTSATGNYTEYGWAFNQPNDDWCAMFICWCARQAGVDDTVIADSASALSNGWGTKYSFNSTSYQNIQPGDIVRFNNSHVALVKKVDDNYIYTIDGNSGAGTVKTSNYYPRSAGGWNDSWKITYYFVPDYNTAPSILTGWQKLGDYWYFYNDDGTIHTGWLTWNNSKYYLDPAAGGRMVKDWKEVNNDWYYFNSVGKMQTGWLTWNSNVFYLDVNGKMLTGRQYIDGYYYYFKTQAGGPKGARITGWSDDFLPQAFSYYDPENSGRATVGWKVIDGNWFYFSFNGMRYVNLVNVDGNLYYFSPSIGEHGGGMHTGWLELENTTYYFNETASPLGAAQRGLFTKPDTGNAYYFDPDTCVMQTGWQAIDGHWYYFTVPNGYMRKGWLNLNGTYYYLDPSSGQMQTGWLNLNGTYYYLDPSSGQMQTGWKTIDDHRYYMESTGEACTGWKKIDNEWYYFYETLGGPKCAMKTGWHWDGNYWYYLTPSSGVMHTGWLQLNGNWYYLCTTTERDAGYAPLGAMLIGTYTINGISYTFDSNGVLQS